MRKRGKVEAFGKVGEDNSLSMPGKGINDMTHLAIWFVSKVKKKVFETDVTLFLLILELLLVIAVFLFFV